MLENPCNTLIRPPLEAILPPQPGPQPTRKRDTERDGQGTGQRSPGSATSMLCDLGQVTQLSEYPPHGVVVRISEVRGVKG